MTPEEELAAWRELGQVFWPHLKYVGLFSGNIQLSAAVKRLADLMGIQEEQIVQAAETKLAANETLRKVRELYVEKYYRQMLSRKSEEFLRDLENINK